MADDFSPIRVGDQTIFAPQFLRADGTARDLTGCSIAMKMHLRTEIASTVVAGTVKTCSNTWVIDDAVNGKAHRRWDVVDTNVSGEWDLEIIITDSSGNPEHADDGYGSYKQLVILPD